MEFQELLNERRSVRAYEPGRSVSRETVEAILRAAAKAPSWKNSQTARSYVALSDEAKAKVRAALPAFNQNNSANASALIVTAFVTKRSGFNRQGEAENELGDEWGAYDLGLRDELLVLAAKEQGLDSLIMGIRDGDALRAALSIPDDQQVVSVIALGYGATKPEMPPRKDVAATAAFF